MRARTSSCGIVKTSQSEWAMAWAEDGRAVEELDLAEELAGAEDGERLLPHAGHHLADAHAALVDDVELAARRRLR